MQTRFKIGDKVRFLNETGGGIIVRIDDKGMAYVESEDGFEIPALLSALIPAEGFDKAHMEHENMADLSVTETQRKKTIADPLPNESGTKPMQQSSGVEPLPQSSGPGPSLQSSGTGPLPSTYPLASLPSNVSDSEEFNIILGFTPEHPGPVFSSLIDCFLINDSEYGISYQLGTGVQGKLHYLSSGMIEPNTKYLINTFNHTDLSKISAVHVQVIWLSRGSYARKPAVDRMIETGSVNFSKESYYFENEYFESRAVLFYILGDGSKPGKPGRTGQESLSRLKQAMTSGDHVPRRVKKPATDTMEIDLHIENLVDDPGSYSAGEILALQMKRLDESMEEAISKSIRRFVIIHGVGQGTLKLQIRKELQEKYPEYQFQDASFREYGFGATLVHLHTIRKQ